MSWFLKLKYLYGWYFCIFLSLYLYSCMTWQIWFHLLHRGVGHHNAGVAPTPNLLFPFCKNHFCQKVTKWSDGSWNLSFLIFSMRVIWSPYYGAYGVTWCISYGHHIITVHYIYGWNWSIRIFGLGEKYQVSQRFFITMLMFFVTMLMLMFLDVQNSIGDRVTHSLTALCGYPHN